MMLLVCLGDVVAKSQATDRRNFDLGIIDIRRQGRTPGGVPTAYAEADP